MIATRPRIGRRLVRASSMGSLPVLPSGFTGFSLDAKDGLQLWKNGILQARYSSDGGAGVLQAYSGYQPVDATHRCRLRYELPPNAVNIILASSLSFSLQAFRATQQTASGAGSLHNHTVDTTHQHRWAAYDGTLTDDVRQFKEYNVYASGVGYVGMQLPNDFSVALPGHDLLTDNTGGVSSTSGNEGSHPCTERTIGSLRHWVRAGRPCVHRWH